MAKPRLIIDEVDRYEYAISWWFPDECETGGSLGDDVYTEAKLAKVKPEDWDHVAATIAASKTEGVKRTTGRYTWETRGQATAALRAVKCVLVSGGKPWPEWATKAAAEGWKAPKGWKP